MSTSLKNIPRAEYLAISVSLGVGIALLVIKFVAYFMTESAAIFSDALESIVNVMASSVAFYCLVLAHRPADAEHPYGHGKVEFISASFEGGMILLAAVAILAKGIDDLVHTPTIRANRLDVGMALMAVALVVNGLVGLNLIRIGRKQDSMTLVADGKHLMTDSLDSVAALIGVGIVRVTGWTAADPITALLIAGYIGWMGVGLLHNSLGGLMDRQSLADDHLLKKILDSHVGPSGAAPQICSFHKLRHRHSGRVHWIDFHIRVPAILHVREGHAIATAIENEVCQALGEANAIAHVEPCTTQDCAVCDATHPPVPGD
jgi:cation diffusion facilitator family transporter